jgi:endonuclease YncB( thermonuclease family)
MEKFKQLASRFIKWFSNWYVLQYQKRGYPGKIFVAFVSLFVLLGLCSVPAAILSPSTPNLIVLGMEARSTVKPTEIASPALSQVKLNPCLQDNAETQQGKVVQVTDGDTIQVIIDGVDHPVRYIGIDTPEKNETYSQEATNRNSELVAGKNVVLVKDTSETDIDDRLLRYVFVDGVFVNETLVKEGYALTMAYPPDTSCKTLFELAQEEAKTQKIGLWLSAPIVILNTPTTSTSSCPFGCNE